MASEPSLSPRRPDSAWSATNPGNRAARAELRAAVLGAAESQLRGNGALLDCGCGYGWLLAALVEAGAEPRRLHGVDRDPERVEAAARRVPGAAVLAADARQLPFPDGEFAVVFQLLSLSSFGSPRSVGDALAESRRVLAPNGLLLVYEQRLPNPFNPSTRWLRRADLRAAGLEVRGARSLTLFPPLGRRLGALTPALHPRLSRLPPLRSHRLLACRSR
jgi:SAM-dependent methyltransferase